MKLIFTLLLLCATSCLWAQDSDLLKKEKIKYLSNQLQISQSGATIGSEIMDDYKSLLSIEFRRALRIHK